VSFIRGLAIWVGLIVGAWLLFLAPLALIYAAVTHH